MENKSATPMERSWKSKTVVWRVHSRCVSQIRCSRLGGTRVEPENVGPKDARANIPLLFVSSSEDGHVVVGI